MTRLALAPGILAAIAARAEAAAPDECCGLLVGRRDGDALTVTEAVAAANTAPDPARRFEVDPAVLLATHRRAREAGEELLGSYHSHPGHSQAAHSQAAGAALPSATDLARAREAGAAGEVWLIVPVALGRGGDGGQGAGANAVARAGAPGAYLFDGGDFVALELAAAAAKP